MKKLRLLITSIVTGSLLLTAPLALAAADCGDSAQNQSQSALSDISPGSGSCDTTGNNRVSNLLKTAINIISFIAGVIAVIMIIVSGFKFVTSDGDATQIANSRKTLIYAIIGLIVVAISQVLVKFVLGQAK